MKRLVWTESEVAMFMTQPAVLKAAADCLTMCEAVADMEGSSKVAQQFAERAVLFHQVADHIIGCVVLHGRLPEWED